ncbi:MAG: class I SAM-dependent methyltransferase [Chloroflexota bacterium]
MKYPHRQPFNAHLRSEYDPLLLKDRQRLKKASQLKSALASAGLWIEQARILDVGCGSGLILAALNHGVLLKVGCDLRTGLYLQAGAKVGSVNFIQSDAITLPFADGCFDMVLCLATIEEFGNWQLALQEMSRLVSSGGILYLTVTNGVFLEPVYTFAKKIGFHIPQSWWVYARNSLPILSSQPEAGMGIHTLGGWQFTNITPHLARTVWPWLHLIPLRLLVCLTRYLTPSFAYAWKRPGKDDE